MKQKSIVWRILTILLLAFLWGGNLEAYAKLRQWAKLDKTTETLTFYYTEHGDNFAEYEFEMPDVIEGSRDYEDEEYAKYIKKVVFDPSFANARTVLCYKLFFHLHYLETIEGFEYLNTAEVDDMRMMFDECRSLKELDLSTFDTRNLRYLYDMFFGCTNLTTIYVSDKFVTDEKYPNYMFRGCINLQGDISYDENCVTSKYAKAVGGYFTNIVRPYATLADGTLTFQYGYKKGLAKNEYRVYGNETTPEWLYQKSSIKRVEFDNSFAEARPTSCYEWFQDCTNLEAVDSLEYFNTSEVQTMDRMFAGCSYGLKSLDLSKLDVSNVTNMFQMFYDCRALTELDLTGFNTAKVKNARDMFRGCSNLTTIYADELFTLADDASSANMFTGCNNLKGDIVFDPNTTDKTYATTDGGYLSQKSETRMWAKYADGTLTFYYSAKKKLGDDEYSVSYSTPSWHDKAGEIKKVVFDESCGYAHPTSCYQWFKDANQLTTIEGLENFNTTEVTNMSWMFYGCSSLSELDLSKLKMTQKVTNMSWMFYGCSSLKSLNLIRLRRSFPKVTDFSRMFMGCSSLTELNFNSFATTKAECMTAMFYGCSSLTSLDLTSFNTSKVWALNSMFNGCTSLKTLDLSSFDTYKCRYFDKMFYGCSNLETIYATEKFAFDPYRLDLESAYMFEGCNKLVGATTFNSYITNKAYARVDGGYFTDKQYTRPWASFNDGQLIFWYGYKKELGANEYLIHADPRDNTDLLAIMPQVKTALFYNFRLYHPTSCASWFKGANQLTTIEYLESLNTSEVTDMSSMFEGCTSLTSLNPYRLSTEKVTNMANMFKDCSSVTMLHLGNFNTASVTDMHDMFAGCTSLRTIIATNNFATTNVENSTNMFADCTKLKGAIAFDPSATDQTYAKSDGGYFSSAADINAWVTFSEADESLTFQYGNKPTLGDNEYWLNQNANTPDWNQHMRHINKVVFDQSFCEARPSSCHWWFNGGANIRNIEGLEYLNTSSVTTMCHMFYDCIYLNNIDLSHFDTKRVTNMNSMFYHCFSVEKLDVSSFNTSAVTDMENMFDNISSKAKYIFLGDDFVVNEGVGNSMFNNIGSTPIYVVPSRYDAMRTAFADINLKPYFSINAKSPYGTLCVPFGSTLTEGSYTGFDKLYRVTNANATEGTITLEETTTINPGVAYVYRRNLPVDAEKSIISFKVDDNVASVSEPQNDGNLMKGTFKRISAPEGSYVLQTDGDFHPVAAGSTIKVGTYRAYLDLSSITGNDEAANSKAFRIVFDDKNVTGINNINHENAVDDNADQQVKIYFDLMGRKVNTPLNGNVYIENGKKVMYNK